jgi:2-polyprenyl-3-methyl-5-hydroxy-6-metoxy-1,4-benzoquinol methylase
VNRGQLKAPKEMRFAFGKNWSRFLSLLDNERITEAERSLVGMLGMPNLKGISFLDIGSGSGLFSLAAKRLGATTVRSFDYDTTSVACTQELKRRFFPDDQSWTIEKGSVLDDAYIRSLGSYDIVYSWGVLHHTGDMWRALSNAIGAVKPGGRLFIAIYNDQGATSRRWLAVKRLYNSGPAPIRAGLLIIVGGYYALRKVLRRLLFRGKTRGLSWWREKRKQRGMSVWYDLVDWVGGYPFEVATPEQVFDFCRARGLILCRLETVGGKLGNNQFVFEKTTS